MHIIYILAAHTIFHNYGMLTNVPTLYQNS